MKIRKKTESKQNLDIFLSLISSNNRGLAGFAHHTHIKRCDSSIRPEDVAKHDREMSLQGGAYPIFQVGTRAQPESGYGDGNGTSASKAGGRVPRTPQSKNQRVTSPQKIWYISRYIFS